MLFLLALFLFPLGLEGGIEPAVPVGKPAPPPGPIDAHPGRFEDIAGGITTGFAPVPNLEGAGDKSCSGAFTAPITGDGEDIGACAGNPESADCDTAPAAPGPPAPFGMLGMPAGNCCNAPGDAFGVAIGVEGTPPIGDWSLSR